MDEFWVKRFPRSKLQVKTGTKIRTYMKDFLPWAVKHLMEFCVRPFRCNRDSEVGSTLVETMVALALLLTVLVPIIGFMATISINQQARVKVQALNYAQYTMESTLLNRAWSDTLIHPAEGWEVQRVVETDGSLVLIRVDVFQKNKPEPVLHLSTTRLEYTPGNESIE